MKKLNKFEITQTSQRGSVYKVFGLSTVNCLGTYNVCKINGKILKLKFLKPRGSMSLSNLLELIDGNVVGFCISVQNFRIIF
jgi:hypothetical protein